MHYYKKRIPRALPPLIDTRRWGPGERLVFEPYTKEAHSETFDWISRHGIFAEGAMGHGRSEDSAVSLRGAAQVRAPPISDAPTPLVAASPDPN